MCVDSYKNNIYEQEAFADENTALTQAEIDLLGLSPTFPKTDAEMCMLNR